MKTPTVTEVFLPDNRGVEVSRYGLGNLKIGKHVLTYSRLPGDSNLVSKTPTGLKMRRSILGTCPGSSTWCEEHCYAKRIGGVVKSIYEVNSLTDEVPPLPDFCRLLRLHVSGDFDSVAYISNWVTLLTERQDVTCWAYTRSWGVPALLPALEELRALSNVQLFASMDESMEGLPPQGWRRAWIEGDTRVRDRHTMVDLHISQVGPGRVPSYVCPEETGQKEDCVSCGYCFKGQKHDVTFLRH